MFYTENKVHSFIYFYSHVYLYIVFLFALWVGSLSIHVYFSKALPDFSNAQCLEFNIDKIYLRTGYRHLRVYPGIKVLILLMLSYIFVENKKIKSYFSMVGNLTLFQVKKN